MRNNEDQTPTHPTHFYKYKAISDSDGGNDREQSKKMLEHLSQIFTRNELYFSSVGRFNDPFDCKFKVDSSCSPVDRRRYHQYLLEKYEPSSDSSKIQEILDAADKNLAPGLTKFFDKMVQDGAIREAEEWGLYCLSTVPDNILMWAHYANDHQGFCLEFLNATNQQFRVEPNPEERGNSPKVLVPLEVQYSEKYPVVNFIRNFIHSDRVTAGITTCLRKAKQWEYEQEWRIVDINGPGPHHFPPECLSGVIFGCRMSDKHKEMIRGWCQDRHPTIKYYQARQSEEEYRLHIEEIP
ncbi:MAG: DUF2971 domain-containing protein [Gammaproteobacteria bacterium]|nr:DUF2971 domain-containing protein [Gammaproteobacteria bacterium]